MAHILAVPFPLQGHINPLMHLCHRLASNGIHVTLVTAPSITPNLQPDSNLITIETVPDVPGTETPDIYEAFFRSYRAAITAGLPDIIERHRDSLKAVVYDSISPWVLDIAHAKGLKGASLFTQSCTVSAVFCHLHEGTLEIPPDDGALVSLPGMPVMEVGDLPSLVYDVGLLGCYGSILRVMVEQFSSLEKADWRLFNTFDKLEDEILIWMRKKYTIQTIGPTVPSMYTDKRIPGNYDYGGLSFFKPKTESYMKWLDEKEDRSVIYASFGSLANLTEKQMSEVAYGLTDSNCNFLWVVRETEHSKLPQDFTSEKGLIVNWCTQLEVLSHRAVGCFFTHCGWNSTLEALALGMPMVVMPQWTDQVTNAKMIADVWGIGVRVRGGRDGVVGRGEIADRVKDVMSGDKGGEIRRNAMRWRDLAVEAVSEGGSSDGNITEFATQLLGK